MNSFKFTCVQTRFFVSVTVLSLTIGLLMLPLGCGTVFPGDTQPTPAPTAEPQTDTPEDVARAIEEADIVKVVDNFFYLANTFAGLRIIDATDVANPTMAGGLQLGGRGVELLVQDDQAYVFTSAQPLDCASDSVGLGSSGYEGLADPDFEGSRLWIVDVTDKNAPALISYFDFDGYIAAARQVGDVIYLAGNISSGGTDTDGEATVFVKSINIADPDNVTTVDQARFESTVLDIHVSDQSLYIFGDDPDMVDTTRVTYIGISDPDGDLVVGDQFRVPGQVKNRFFVDEYEDTFRVITEEFNYSTWSGEVALYVYDVSSPGDVQRIAELPIVSEEELHAVRFDGTKAYAVTYEYVDPLFVLDLSDPTEPTISGQLNAPGYSTHIVPLGDRLVAVGFDDTSGIRPSVALYNVANTANPTRLDLVTVGDAWSWDTDSEATVDEKALRVLEEAGLILLPFSQYDYDHNEYVDSLQIIQLGQTSLTERGTIDHVGLIRRADLLDDRLWVLSDLSFQTVNIDDLGSPTSLATVTINSEQDLLDAGLSNCVDYVRTYGTRIGGEYFYNEGYQGWGRGILCGAMPLPMMALTLSSLLVIRLTRRRN